jgi:hypothetical protein
MVLPFRWFQSVIIKSHIISLLKISRWRPRGVCACRFADARLNFDAYRGDEELGDEGVTVTMIPTVLAGYPCGTKLFAHGWQEEHDDEVNEDRRERQSGIRPIRRRIRAYT